MLPTLPSAAYLTRQNLKTAENSKDALKKSVKF